MNLEDVRELRRLQDDVVAPTSEVWELTKKLEDWLINRVEGLEEELEVRKDSFYVDSVCRNAKED